VPAQARFALADGDCGGAADFVAAGAGGGAVVAGCIAAAAVDCVADRPRPKRCARPYERRCCCCCCA